MSGKRLFGIFGLVLVAVITDASITGIQPRMANYEKHYYFPDDSEERTYEEAKQFCISEGGVLAKITDSVLYTILLTGNQMTKEKSYWIDGKATIGSAATDFETAECPGKPHLDGITNIDIGTTEACLTMFKGQASAENKIKSQNCAEKAGGVICAIVFSDFQCPP